MRTLNRVALTIAEQDGGDSRIGEEKGNEIDRIKECKSLYEIFGVESDCSESDLKKAFYRLAKVIHPDKNTHPDATAAMKMVNESKETLMGSAKRQQYDRHPTRPKWSCGTSARGSMQQRLKVLKCHAQERRHLTIQIIRDSDELGARIVARSYANHAEDQEMLKFLDAAWSNRSDGFLSVETGEKFRVDCVRQKTKHRFTDGDLKVIIDHVRQKDIGGEPMERWEVEIRSCDLKTAAKSLCSKDGPPASRNDVDAVRRLFHAYVSGVNGLLTAFAEAENSACTITDGGTQVA